MKSITEQQLINDLLSDEDLSIDWKSVDFLLKLYRFVDRVFYSWRENLIVAR